MATQNCGKKMEMPMLNVVELSSQHHGWDLMVRVPMGGGGGDQFGIISVITKQRIVV